MDCCYRRSGSRGQSRRSGGDGKMIVFNKYMSFRTSGHQCRVRLTIEKRMYIRTKHEVDNTHKIAIGPVLMC